MAAAGGDLELAGGQIQPGRGKAGLGPVAGEQELVAPGIKVLVFECGTRE
jgi:hypothetical protein